MNASTVPHPDTDLPINSRPSGRAPAFQFYAADYLSDENVTLMTLEEEGAHIRALAYCWREGSIPADDILLARLLKGASANVLATIKRTFNASSTDVQRLTHPRLEIEREKQRIWREQKSIAGRASGKARKPKDLPNERTFNGRSTAVQRTFNSSSSSVSVFSLQSSSTTASPTTASPEREEAARSAGGGLAAGPNGPPVLKSHGLSLPENPNDEDARTIMKIVVDAIGVTTRFPKEAIFTQAQHELKKYLGDIEGISKGMIGAYEEFTLCYQQGKVRRLIGAEKFFGEGRWNSWQSWGFRKGTRPQSGYVEYADVSVSEEGTEQPPGLDV